MGNPGRSTGTAGRRASTYGRLQKWAACVTLLTFGQTALAGGFQHLSSKRNGGSAAAPPSADAAAAAAAAAQAQAAARRAQGSLGAAFNAIRNFQASQEAARAAAMAQVGSVPNGIAPGGLEVDPTTGAIWQGADPTIDVKKSDGGRVAVTVTQTDSKAILGWKTFNVGKETDLHFDQTKGGQDASGWVVLNRVTDPSAAPSRILGSIKAEGQVYVINRNGIIFGGTSQVNASALVASGLDLYGGNSQFLAGLASGTTPTFGGDKGTQQTGAVLVQPGAKIAVNNYGQVLLIGYVPPAADGSVRDSVVNQGWIEAPDGQVVLAAGSSVTLAKGVTSSVTTVRGYTVDVAGTGAAVNAGLISTARGNITMKGAQIEQNGLLTATTGSDANGSIWLGTDASAIVSGTATITFGQGSITQILPDDNGKKVVGRAKFTDDSQRSQVTAYAEKIVMLEDSTIYAPSGVVTLSTRPGVVDKLPEVDPTRIYLSSGARIDVSGLPDVEAPMEQNEIQGELRAAELADNTVVRSGSLHGGTVYFDARLGGKLTDGTGVANLSGYYNLIARDIDQLMTAGGTVNLAANEIITRKGSTIDLSGGSVRYQDGYIRTTMLIDPSGRPVPIDQAVAGVPYVGMSGQSVVVHSRWGTKETYSSPFFGAKRVFQAGYEEGRDAGTLKLDTNPAIWLSRPDRPAYASNTDPFATGAIRILDGKITADTSPGIYQRELPSSSTDPTVTWKQRPHGATLDLEKSGSVTFAKSDSGELAVDLRADTAVGADDVRLYELTLPEALFGKNGFTQVVINSGQTDDTHADNSTPATRELARGGTLKVLDDAVLDLGDGGSFQFTGKQAEILGSLEAPGGSVSITAKTPAYDTDWASLKPEQRPTIRVDGKIDVAGRWSNDVLDKGTGPYRALNGGTVSLVGYNVELEKGSMIDVGGGARLDASGTSLKTGNGGALTIDVTQGYKFAPSDSTTWVLPDDAILARDGSELRGYAPGTGGSLSIKLPDAIKIAIGEQYDPAFFTKGGFSRFALTGIKGVTVAEDLNPQVQTLVMATDARNVSSGAHLTDPGMTHMQVLNTLEGHGKPMTVSLSAVPGGTSYYAGISQAEVQVQTGKHIQMNPGSTVQLAATGAVRVDGPITAKGGDIELIGVTPVDSGGKVTTEAPATVELGAGAHLDVSGYHETKLQGGLTRGSVEAAGQIVIKSEDQIARGTPTVHLALVMDGKSVLDASGLSGTADLASRGSGNGPFQETFVDGSAGSIIVYAKKGILDGVLRLAPGSPSGAGGTLEVHSINELRVQQDSAAQSGSSGLTVVADVINRSGADDVSLDILGGVTTAKDSSVIRFDGEVALEAGRSITLKAPFIRATVKDDSVRLNADYVHFSGTPGETMDPHPQVAGDAGATLAVTAKLIDFENAIWLGCKTSGCTGIGFGSATFTSAGDIRLSDATSGAAGQVGIFAAGDLVFNAAQLYVTSRQQPLATATSARVSLQRADDDPGFLIQTPGTITIGGGDSTAPVPLSFGERLTLRAANIEQGGVVRAPLGQLRFEASKSVNLLPGSVTSVSLVGADGNAAIVPFGQVGTDGSFTGYAQAGSAPVKSIDLSAPEVAVQEKAVVDVRGGGDLLGYRFIAGNQGSRDVMTLPNTFAVLPSLGARPAPLGGTAGLTDSTLKVGDVVWLHGVSGLPDGYYSLLPAHYALLPGGLLIQSLGGSFASAQSSFVRSDGAVIASGYRANQIGSDLVRTSQGWSSFAVLSHDVAAQYGQIITPGFTSYATNLATDAGAAVRTPNDAGKLVISAQDLILKGQGRFEAGAGGQLGDIDIAASKIAVTGADTQGNYDASYLVLDATSLTKFGAGSLFLGGSRSESGAGTNLNVTATDVVVDTGSSFLQGPELLFAATNSVSVKDGSTIQAKAPQAIASGSGQLRISGDSALLRLSAGERVDVKRTNIAGAGGVLDVGNATLSAARSMTLDATRSVKLAPRVALSAAQLDLASNRVNLGDVPSGDEATGTSLGSGLIAGLTSSSSLVIRGYDSIHLYGSVALGSQSQAVTLDTALLQGHAGDGVTAQIVAGELTLRNSSNGGTSAGTAGPGTLNLKVNSLVLGPGDLRLAGFGSLTGSAGNILAQDSGSLAFAGDLSLATSQVAAKAGASYALVADGKVSLSSGTGTALSATDLGLGGKFAVAGSAVELDTSALLPAGSFEARATSGDLRIGKSAKVDVTGSWVDFQGQRKFAPGGSVKLSAAHDLSVAAGASLDVSGSSAGGDAGTVELTAGGQTSVEGTLRGAASAGYQGGAFAIDSGTVADLSALNAKLEGNGFNTRREVRLRTQSDLALDASDKITAHEVVLRADAGNVTVAGAIDASGDAAHPSGGIIEITAGGRLHVDDSATMTVAAGQAAPGGYDPASGQMELASTSGRVDIDSRARLDLSGGRSGGGVLVVRAPRTSAGFDLQANLNGQVKGARAVIVQGSQAYQTDRITTASDQTMIADASAWLSSARSAVASRLSTNASLTQLQVGAGIEVSSSSDLAVGNLDGTAASLELATLAGPNHLGLTAAHDLSVNGVVSDGFDSSGALQGGLSSSYRLEAGNDLSLTAGSVIRTGTGGISLRAGGDLLLGNLDPTIRDPRAAIYTAGRRNDAAEPHRVSSNGSFGVDGGDVAIAVGGSIQAVAPTQSTSAWLFRTGSSHWDAKAGAYVNDQGTTWSVVYPNFNQGVGALGGGDVRVRAGGDVNELQIAIPTTGYLTTAKGQAAKTTDLVVNGAGDLELTVGGDLRGGLFVLGRGHAEVRAGGSLTGGDLLQMRSTPATADQALERSVAPLFGLMDGTVRVTAAGAIDIEAAFDPMLQEQVQQNLGSGGTGTAFSSYSAERTSLEASSLGGSVTYENDPWASVDLSLRAPDASLQVARAGGASTLVDRFRSAPPTLRLTSLQSDVILNDPFNSSSINTSANTLSLASSSSGTMELLAKDDIRFLVASVKMEEISSQYVRDALAPLGTVAPTSSLSGTTFAVDPLTPTSTAPAVARHIDDSDPIRIYALEGSVCADLSGVCLPTPYVKPSSFYTSLSVPKSIDVYAGKDVYLGSYLPQNNGPEAVSSIRAGRDIYDVNFAVSGTGQALLEAGRNVFENAVGGMFGAIDGTGGAIVSRGNLNANLNGTPGSSTNPALPGGQAADVTVIAGAAGKMDYDGFAAAYLDPSNGQHLVRTYLPELAKYLKGLDATAYSSITDPAKLVQAFGALPRAQRIAFLDQVYFTELKETGIDYNDKAGPRYHSYRRGFDAVAKLFDYQYNDKGDLVRKSDATGDVILAGNALVTWANAGITVLAPYGQVEVGTPVPPSAAFDSLGGIVTRRGGDIHVMADQSIYLYSSRVFTLQGGDITIWSTHGDVGAGAASKTTVSNVPLTYNMSNDGAITVNVFGLSTGGGIGVLDALQNSEERAPSRMDLLAPNGKIDAGDAGIRVKGSLNVAAAEVVGVENIQVSGGKSAGVPTVEPPNVGALTSASSVAKAAAQEGVGPAAQPKTTLADLPSIITVEVVGYESSGVDDKGSAEDPKKKR